MQEAATLVFRQALERQLGAAHDDVWAHIVPLASLARFPAGTHVLRAGQTATRFGFVLEGIVREYATDASGREDDIAFIRESELFGPLSELTSGEPSKLNVESLEDVRAVMVDWAAFEALCAAVPAVSELARRVYARLFAHVTEREKELQSLSAEERYARFRERFPELEDRLPQYRIASYLNMTPEHLSRIRKRAKA